MEQFEQLLLELHEVAGICGHCGKKKCFGKKKNSILPKKIEVDVFLTAMEKVSKSMERVDD